MNTPARRRHHFHPQVTDGRALESDVKRTREAMLERIDRLARYAVQCTPEERGVFLEGILSGEAERAMLDGEPEDVARREARSIREGVEALVEIRLGRRKSA